MMRVTVFLMMAMPIICFAQMYKWTDEKGRVHFGDSPRQSDNSEPIFVKVNSYENVTYEEIEFYQPADSIKNIKVTLFSTSWCGFCKLARDYFRLNNIAFREYDIEASEEARKMYDSIGGRGVPVIIVGQKRMNGFNVAGFESLYQDQSK